MSSEVPYKYKFSRGVIFTNNRSRVSVVLFLRIICQQPLSSICIVIVLKKFENLIFVDNKLPAKTAKITPLKNLCIHGI